MTTALDSATRHSRNGHRQLISNLDSNANKPRHDEDTRTLTTMHKKQVMNGRPKHLMKDGIDGAYGLI